MSRCKIDRSASGVRLDRWLAEKIPDLSRGQCQKLIASGKVHVDGTQRKASYRLAPAQTISWTLPEPESNELLPEDIPLNTIYDDDDILVLNKPAGMVVHPAPGHQDGTLANALVYHYPALADVGESMRPGIVHRIDKDTSGILLVAKNAKALCNLQRQFKNHQIGKRYLALVYGIPNPECETIKTLIGRHKHKRKKMAVKLHEGRDAISHYKTVERFRGASLLEIEIKTGRTHQIRVHLAHIGNPILGDRKYANKRKSSGDYKPKRQMLHAHRLELRHPRTGKKLLFEAALPDDMENGLRILRNTDERV